MFQDVQLEVKTTHTHNTFEQFVDIWKSEANIDVSHSRTGLEMRFICRCSWRRGLFAGVAGDEVYLLV